MSPADSASTRPLLDKLGLKPGAKVAVVGLEDASFLKLLRSRTQDIVRSKPRTPCDIVFLAANETRDLERLKEVKSWIVPNGAIWAVRPKGGRSALRDTDLIDAGLAAGLVDNRIANISRKHGAILLVFRFRDRSR